MWEDCTYLGKIKFCDDPEREKSPLKYTILELDVGVIIVTGLNGLFIFGI